MSETARDAIQYLIEVGTPAHEVAQAVYEGEDAIRDLYNLMVEIRS